MWGFLVEDVPRRRGSRHYVEVCQAANGFLHDEI